MSEGTTPFLETAFGIGAELCRDALWDGRRANWLGAAVEPLGGRWTVVERTFGPDLYNGTAGIALFLAHLYRATGEPILRATAEGAARQALSRKEDVPASYRVAFYSGWSGIAWALLTLGEAARDERWTSAGLDLFEQAAELDPAGQELDVLGGVAGAVPALLAAARRHDRPRLAEHAVRLGDRLLAAARRRDEGWSWRTLGEGSERLQRDDLTGLSHGTGGIAWALLELGEASGEDRFVEGATEGFRYERHWYSEEHQNWPDLRDYQELGMPGADVAASEAGDASQLVYPVQWCHGAPGVGLTRLRAFLLTGDVDYRREAEAALAATHREFSQPGGQTNYSLCHGRAGNAELFLAATEVLRDAGYREIAEHVGRQGITLYEESGTPWPSGILGGAPTPGLMLGASGTGSFYLRLHDLSAMPSAALPPVP